MTLIESLHALEQKWREDCRRLDKSMYPGSGLGASYVFDCADELLAVLRSFSVERDEARKSDHAEEQG